MFYLFDIVRSSPSHEYKRGAQPFHGKTSNENPNEDPDEAPNEDPNEPKEF
jgi:hypothetical protein